MNKSEIASFIKELRISQFGDKRGAAKIFADYLEVNYTTYRNCERSRVNIDVLIAIREKLGISLDEIVTGHPSSNRRAPPLSNRQRAWLDMTTQFDACRESETRHLRKIIYEAFRDAHVDVDAILKRYK